MNQRTKQYIIAIRDHKAVCGHTNLNSFVEKMKEIEPDFMTRITLGAKLQENNFAFYESKNGTVYEIYRYENPEYKKQSVRKESKMNQ